MFTFELGQHIVATGRTMFEQRQQQRKNKSIDDSTQRLDAALRSLDALIESSPLSQVSSMSRRRG